MPRRSIRLQAKQPILSNSDFLNSVSEDEGNDHPPERKRRRVSNGSADRAVKKKGKLTKFLSLPLDILFETFAHLHPSDLLRLSRTSKSLRKVLLSRTATCVWKRSLANVDDLPECPTEYLSEPAYASLLFDHFCYFCGTRTPNVLWKWLVRTCKSCAKRRLFTLDEEDDECKKFLITATMTVMAFEGHINPETLVLWKYPEATTDAILDSVDEAQKVLPAFILPPDEYKRIVKACNKERRNQWISDRYTRMKELEAFGSLCGKWQGRQNMQRFRELNKFRDTRRNAIKEKLIEMGWAEEFQKMDERRERAFERQWFVKRPKPLTEKEWQNHKDEMVEFMNIQREERFKVQRTQIKRRIQIVNCSLRSYRLPPVFPKLADIYHFPLFHSTMREQPLWALYDTIFYSTAMINQLMAFGTTWKEEKEKELRLLFGTKELCLDRANVLFRCPKCPNPISFPRILVHDHVTERLAPEHDEDYDPTLIHEYGTDDDWYDGMRLVPWGCGGGRVQLYAEAMSVASSILLTCGFDTLTATREDLEQADPYLHCCHPDCFGDGTTRQVMQWQRAILHGLRDHGQLQRSWRLLNPAERISAKKLETPLPPYSFKAYRCEHTCSRLVADHMTFEETMSHLEERHDIQRQNAKIGRDYSYHIDMDMDSVSPGIVGLPW